MSTLFDELLKDETYAKVLNELSKEDAEVIKENMRQLVDGFEAKVLKPIKQLTGEREKKDQPET